MGFNPFLSMISGVSSRMGVAFLRYMHIKPWKSSLSLSSVLPLFLVVRAGANLAVGPHHPWEDWQDNDSCIIINIYLVLYL